MIQKISQRLSFESIFKTILLIALLIMVALNLSQLYRDIKTIHKIKQKVPFSFPGLKFAGLQSTFKNVPIVGYYTDKDMNQDQNSLVFAQAQLMLAPTILDLNNINHPYIIFDCSSEELAFQKIREIGALPLKKNQGLILAKRLK